MKISLEFKDLRDMLFSLPKFALLIAGDEPAEERMGKAIEPDPEVLQVAITPLDGVAFTDEQKDALKKILASFIKDQAAPPPATKPKKKAAEKPTAAPDKPKEPKASKSTPEPEKPSEGRTDVSGADVRSAFNDLLKNDRRDAVKKILKSFGASNFSGLAEKHYAAAIDEARKYLAMSDAEYEEV